MAARAPSSGTAVMLAEFDIDRGSTIRCVVPEGYANTSEASAAALAELMLPSGCHHREQDWAYALTAASAGSSLTISDPPSEEYAFGDPDTSLNHVYSVVQARKDASKRRGNNVKAVAIAAPFQWVCSLRPVLERVLDALFAAEAGTTAEEWEATAFEICKRSHEQIDAFIASCKSDPSLSSDWLQRMAMRAARVHPGLSHGTSSAGRAAEEAARARPRWAFVAKEVLLPGERPVAVPVVLDRTLEPGCSPSASVSALVSVFGGASPAILTAAACGRRVLVVGGKPVSAGRVASIVLAIACVLEPSLPGTLTRVVPSASLTDLTFLEREGGYIAGVSNPLFRDRQAWWDALCDVESGTVTIKPEVSLSDPCPRETRSLASLVLRLASAEAAAGAGADQAPEDERLEAEGVVSGEGVENTLVRARDERLDVEISRDSAGDAAKEEAGRQQDDAVDEEEEDEDLVAAQPRGSWRGHEIALASKLRSGERFGEAWLREAACASVESLCGVLDAAVSTARRTCKAWVDSSGSLDTDGATPPASVVKRCALALSAVAVLNAPRLAAIGGQGKGYRRRRRRHTMRRVQEAAGFPRSCFAQASAATLKRQDLPSPVGAVTPTPSEGSTVEGVTPFPLPRRAEPAGASSSSSSPSSSSSSSSASASSSSSPAQPLEQQEAAPADPGSPLAGTAGRAEAIASMSTSDLSRLGREAYRSLSILRRAVTAGASAPGADSLVPTTVVRRAVATLLLACQASHRDTLRLSAALPESAGGLLPLAMPLFHRSVPVRAFTAALLQRIEASTFPFVSARTAALNASLLGALERARPLAPAAEGSRELDAVLASLREDPDDVSASAAPSHDATAHLAPFNPTSDAAIVAALDLLRLGPADTLLDVGCGDGRVLVEACLRTGCSGVGVEADQQLVDRALARREEAGLQSRLEIVLGDATKMDLQALGATALFVYLVPEGLRIVWPSLQPLVEKGVRAASYVFRAPGALIAEQRRLGPVSVFLYKADGV